MNWLIKHMLPSIREPALARPPAPYWAAPQNFPPSRRIYLYIYISIYLYELIIINICYLPYGNLPWPRLQLRIKLRSKLLLHHAVYIYISIYLYIYISIWINYYTYILPSIREPALAPPPAPYYAAPQTFPPSRRIHLYIYISIYIYELININIYYLPYGNLPWPRLQFRIKLGPKLLLHHAVDLLERSAPRGQLAQRRWDHVAVSNPAWLFARRLRGRIGRCW